MQEPETILKTINKEIEDFKAKDIQIVPGLTFNQYDTIEKIFFYYNSKFASGEIDSDGDRKYFYNIVRNPCKVFSKAIDFDTKNIRLLTTESGDSLKTWFMERDLKYWMRKEQFGKTLNRIFKELPIFGSVVLKIVNNKPMFVDLRNFVVDQSAETLEDSSSVIEIHNYTPSGFRNVAKNMGWGDKVDEVIREFHKMKGTSHIKVYERYGEVPEGEGDNATYVYKRTFLADVGVDEFDTFGNLTGQKKGVLLGETDWSPEDLPYWEFHADKISGRWLGVGVVETLIEPQIRQNEIANLQAKGSYWSALRVFQSRDPNISRNLLSDVKNGEILNVDSEITAVNMDDRNLAYFNQETEKWLRNRDEMTFSYDAVQGERSPAGTPLGETRINTAQTLSYFEQIQENVALDVKEMLYEVIIPGFQKQNSDEHTLRLVGKDLDEFIGLVKNQLVLQEMIRQAIRSLDGSPFPTEKDRDVAAAAIEESIRQGKEKILTIPKNFYKDVEYDVDIDITGESVDTRVRYATRFAILQAIQANPMLLKDPTTKGLIAGIAEDGGINPNDIFSVESNSIEQMATPQTQMGGGGVSAPDMSQQIPGQTGMTI